MSIAYRGCTGWRHWPLLLLLALLEMSVFEDRETVQLSWLLPTRAGWGWCWYCYWKCQSFRIEEHLSYIGYCLPGLAASTAGDAVAEGWVGAARPARPRPPRARPPRPRPRPRGALRPPRVGRGVAALVVVEVLVFLVAGFLGARL